MSFSRGASISCIYSTVQLNVAFTIATTNISCAHIRGVGCIALTECRPANFQEPIGKRKSPPCNSYGTVLLRSNCAGRASRTSSLRTSPPAPRGKWANTPPRQTSVQPRVNIAWPAINLRSSGNPSALCTCYLPRTPTRRAPHRPLNQTRSADGSLAQSKTAACLQCEKSG